jgi:asparagine synthase (glutamine-hydrolysing)
MTSDAMLEDLTQYAYDFETIGYVLLMPAWRIYRELRRDGVVVSLDGHGADELLAGYEYTLRAAIAGHGGVFKSPARTFDLARTISDMRLPDAEEPSGLLSLLIESDPFLRGTRDGARRAARLARRLAGVGAPRAMAEEIPQWIAQWTGARVEADAEELAARAALSPLNRMLYSQFHHGILPSILRKYDRLSMSHGIETRLPFMDWRLVCFAFALPDESKAGAGMTKRILREAMRGVLPETIRQRTSKIGFRSPMQSWFLGPLGDWAYEQVHTTRFLESDVWNGPAIRDYVAERHKARTWTETTALRVWPYLQANLWRQTFFG